MTPIALVKLLQLASPTLPVGAYTYSQGLEWAVQSGMVHDEQSAEDWISDQLQWNLGRLEAPLLLQLMGAWSMADEVALVRLNGDYLASRETSELLAETLQMGHSLCRLIHALSWLPPVTAALLHDIQRHNDNELAHPVAWSALASHWQLPPTAALAGWLWSWAENQVLAAIKLIPLGQSQGQSLLHRLGPTIDAVTQRAREIPEESYANCAPGYAIAASGHETQYSRLFRS